ncbi:hypothetical protein I315_03886, partial [Cryptococcus gattii Ru294]
MSGGHSSSKHALSLFSRRHGSNPFKRSFTILQFLKAVRRHIIHNKYTESLDPN